MRRIAKIIESKTDYSYDDVMKLVSDKEVYDPRKVIGAGEKNLKEMVDYKLSIFNTRL